VKRGFNIRYYIALRALKTDEPFLFPAHIGSVGLKQIGFFNQQHGPAAAASVSVPGAGTFLRPGLGPVPRFQNFHARFLQFCTKKAASLISESIVSGLLPITLIFKQLSLWV
jgi:hypothetical protein